MWQPLKTCKIILQDFSSNFKIDVYVLIIIESLHIIHPINEYE